jgi:hypothetical protein
MLHMPQRTLSGPGCHLAWPSQKMATKPPEWRVPTFTSTDPAPTNPEYVMLEKEVSIHEHCQSDGVGDDHNAKGGV